MSFIQLLLVRMRGNTWRERIGGKEFDKVVQVSGIQKHLDAKKNATEMDVLVVNAIFPTQVMLDGYSICLEEIDGGLFLHHCPCLEFLCRSRFRRRRIYCQRVKKSPGQEMVDRHLVYGTTPFEQKSGWLR